MHKSIATIDSPQFINLEPLETSPYISSCEIKVCYVGQNRNGSAISKEILTEMSKTLRGVPIVGYYKEQKEDFADHGQVMTIDDEGISFTCLTKPYGFVPPNAEVWFQMFEDYDEFGNKVDREYLMTTGYLWTKQFPEAELAVKEGRPQSMELDNDDLSGHWATDNKSGLDFFIITDAVFSKLCILGDDVEPCFEGASVKAPEVSKNFSNSDFNKSLFTMMSELKEILKGGEKNMENVENVPVEEEVTETPVAEPVVEATEEPVAVEAEEPAPAEDFELKYNELNAQYEDLKTQFELLNNKYSATVGQLQELDALKEFKLNVENAKKDEMIASFYMLSDEDKAEVIKNKANYSLEDIEAKLSVICVRKKVNFNLGKEDTEEKPITTFSLGNYAGTLPDWVQAVKNNKENN